MHEGAGVQGPLPRNVALVPARAEVRAKPAGAPPARPGGEPPPGRVDRDLHRRTDRFDAERRHVAAERGPRAGPAGPDRSPAPPTTFMAQVLGQLRPARAEAQSPGAFADVSDAYRRSGGEPALFSSDAALFRLAV